MVQGSSQMLPGSCQMVLKRCPRVPGRFPMVLGSCHEKLMRLIMRQSHDRHVTVMRQS